MIVEMSRVLIVGPKRLLGAVMDEVQRLGVVHVDRVTTSDEGGIGPLRLDEHAAAQQSQLEAVRARADGLLSLLPAARDDSPQGAGDEFAQAEAVDLDAVLAEAEAEIHDLTRRRLEAEEELELIRTYEDAVRTLSPLLGALSGSRTLETIGFTIRAKDLSVVTALRNQLQDLTGGRVEVVSRTIDEQRIGVVVAFLRRDAETVRGFLSRAGIAELRLPARYAEGGPAEAVRLMQARRAALPGEQAAIAAQLADATRRWRPRLVAVRAAVLDRLAQLRALAQLGESRYTFILHGWTPAPRVAALREALRRRFGGDVVVEERRADPHHHPEEIPVLLDNPPLLRPFQRMLALFRPPRYGTMDPTVFLAIFFPVFVGIVIGDVAYGALLFAFGWWLRNKARRGETWEVGVGPIRLGMRMTPPVLADASWIVRVVAAWVIVFGVLYLEVFGNLVEHYFHLHPLFNRVQLAESFLMLTFALGLTQVMLGYLLHLVLAARHRHAVGVLESLAMICGVAGLIAVLGVMGDRLPPTFFTPGVALLAGFVIFFLLGFLRNRFAMFWLIETISGMGHVFSYARLFGVGLAAAVLANVSNELGAMFGPVWIGIFIGIVIQLVFFVFTLPGHVIQPARLNWVEFLTKVKYHDETGNSYRPLQKTGGD